MKYQSHRVAYYHFIAALLLFALQVVAGLVIGTQYVFPDFLYQTLDFNVVRTIHINLLIVWILIGFMGASYYLVVEESETEVWSPMLAHIHLVAFVLGGVAAIVGYLLGYTDGREFLEQPFIIKVAIALVVVAFVVNVIMTIIKGGRWTSVEVVLVLGLVGAALFFLPALGNHVGALDNLSVDKYFWWWTVHLWVEGVWELIMGAMLSFLLLKLTGVDREVLEKWLYVIVGLVFFSGILGTGHHYYWEGYPSYWLWIGGIMSAAEPFAFLGMTIYAFSMLEKAGRAHPNRAAIYFTLGCALFAFLGAGVWGLMHTLPQVNKWTHGSQITASHGHLAFFGAYAMINLAMMTYAIPAMQGREGFNKRTALIAFWLMAIGMTDMTLALFGAGVVQSFMERYNHMPFMDVQNQMWLFYAVRLAGGVIFAAGVGYFIKAFFERGVPRAA
jgi:nitric oxide reductase subunit B